MTTRTPTPGPRAAPPLLISGAVLLMVANIVHPVDADPTPVSRFEFATEPTWIPIHLALAIGFLLLAAGLVAVARQMRRSSFAHFAVTTALAGGTLLAAVFGAFDGYAVSVLAASDVDSGTILPAAVAEEAIDSGLAAMGTLTLFGLAIGALGLAFLREGLLQRWIGWSALVIGAAGTVAGTALLVKGPTPFTINVMLRPAAVAGTLWTLALGIALRSLALAGPAGQDAPEHAATAAT